MRTKWSTWSGVLKTTGHVVFAGTLESEATFIVNWSFPRPIARGSEIASHWKSWTGSLSSESPLASLRIRTPGATQGSSGGGGGAGVTSFEAAPSPVAFTAETLYV